MQDSDLLPLQAKRRGERPERMTGRNRERADRRIRLRPRRVPAQPFCSCLGASAPAQAGSRSWRISGKATAWSDSLLGYGATPDIRPDGNATMAQQVDSSTGHRPDRHVSSCRGALVRRTLRHCACLDGRHRPASLLLVEANPLGLLRASGDLEHYRMFEAMTAVLR